MRKKDLLRTLFSRMLSAHITVTVGLLILAGVAVLAFVRADSRKVISERADSAFDAASAICREYLDGNLSGDDARTRMTYTVDSDTCIQVINSDCSYEVYFSDGKWDVPRAYMMSKERLDVLFYDLTIGHTVLNGFFGDLTDFPVRTRLGIVYRDNDPAFLILIHSDLTDVNTRTDAVALIILIVVLFAALVTIFVTFYTTNSLTKPFLQVNDIVQQYSKGDYNVRIPVSDTEEATQLALSFNAMADQLNDLEQTRRSFVANVSHELRSPLTSMKGFLEAMHDGTIEPQDFGQYIDIVLSETKRMTNMVNDLLDLARIESGKTAVNFEVFDVNELIRRTLITFEARIYERKHDVDIRFATEQCFVEADSSQISQVLRNLIDNAIKYSPEGTEIRISTYAMRREVFVSVQNFGQEIPEEDAPHIFDRFYKVEKAHTPTKQSGTGLGLSIVKKIIDQHGQRIHVKSGHEKGTIFTFTLKRALNPRNAKNQ